MKQSICVFLIISLMLLITCTTVYAASSQYEFVMKQRLVSGKDNGMYHNLSKGTVYIKGTQKNVRIDGQATLQPNNVYYSLLRDKVGPDKKCGTINVKGTDTSISKKLGVADTKSNKYYLQIYKAEVDKWKTTGEGKVYN